MKVMTGTVIIWEEGAFVFHENTKEAVQAFLSNWYPAAGSFQVYPLAETGGDDEGGLGTVIIGQGNAFVFRNMDVGTAVGAFLSDEHLFAIRARFQVYPLKGVSGGSDGTV